MAHARIFVQSLRIEVFFGLDRRSAVTGGSLVRLLAACTVCRGRAAQVEHSAEVRRLEENAVAGTAVVAEERKLVEPRVRGCR